MITLNSSTTLTLTSYKQGAKLNSRHREKRYRTQVKKAPGRGHKSSDSSKLKNQLLGTSTDRLSVLKVAVAIATPLRNRTVHRTAVSKILPLTTIRHCIARASIVKESPSGETLGDGTTKDSNLDHEVNTHKEHG